MEPSNLKYVDVAAQYEDTQIVEIETQHVLFTI